MKLYDFDLVAKQIMWWVLCKFLDDDLYLEKLIQCRKCLQQWNITELSMQLFTVQFSTLVTIFYSGIFTA